MPTSADVVICGAGIAGIAAAHELAVKSRAGRVLIVTDHPPMSVTSDKSTECYRNFWPGPDGAMIALMNQSIDRLTEIAHATGNAIRMNRRGYVYATSDPARIASLRASAALAEKQSAGPLRETRYVPNDPEAVTSPATSTREAATGADLITDPAVIRTHFPHFAPDTAAVLHVRRAGWFSGHELGMVLLESARAAGTELRAGRVTAIERDGEGVAAVRLADGDRIVTRRFVLAAGPWLRHAAHELLQVELPVFSELHAKLAFHDHLAIVPREAPLLIDADPQRIAWSADEESILAGEESTQLLLAELPGGAHTRPEGGAGSQVLLMLWAYDAHPVPEAWPPTFAPMFPEVVLRGLTRLIPGLRTYVGRAPKPVVDGGYYTKTRENRPLIGPTAVPGAYVIGALSGYGLMVACGAAELLAAHVTGCALPDIANAFVPGRYADPDYAMRFARFGDTGQL